MEKSLYSLPAGIAVEAEVTPEVEIEIDMEGGDEPAVEIEVKLSSFDDNLAENMDEGDLQMISEELLQFIQDDITSRKDWERTYKEGLDLLGLRIDERTEPWDGACGVYHPILSESVVKFQSETILETFPASGPVKTKIIREQILPDTTNSTAELVSVANRSERTAVSISFIVETKASAIFFEKNLKWLGYKSDQPDSCNHKTFFKDTNKGVQIASVYYAP
jgi:hypothetical protein